MADAVRLILLIYFHLSIISFNLAQDVDQFVYNGFLGANLHLDGIAEIHPNGLLQLTNTSKQKMGHAFYRLPLKFSSNSASSSESMSFSTIFVFVMVPEMQNLSGHGIAFTISPSLDFSLAVASQYLGLLNTSNDGLSTNHILAVELDTIRSPDVQDANENHVGIDVNSLNSIESASATYFSNTEGKNRSLNLVSGDPIQVWIDYNETETLLNVTLAPISSPKPNQLLLSTSINLSEILLESMYVGFSAATGTLASDHYILGWSFNKAGRAQSLDISKLPSPPPHRKAEKEPKVMIVVILVAVMVVIVTITVGTYIIRRKKYEEICDDWEREYGPQRFSYKNLYKATKGFKDRELLGAGGFGKVYRGVLPSSNLQVAVKKVSHDSKQGIKEFVAEIASVGRLRHRNLVQLLGYCRRREELLLVYDYMPNGSLDKFLFTNEKPALNWSQRFQILKGVASGLLYLHEEWEQVVLHRDIKASNVLLDGGLNGRLGDFGLARLYNHDSNPQTTHVVGTVGYLAPELARFGKATTSTDVFAFGAFLLEVACGRRPIELLGLPEEVILVDWVIECWKRGAILDASDPRLEGNYVIEEMELVLKLGLICSHSVPTVRPSMRQVMQYLNGDATLPDVTLESAAIGTFITCNEASDFVMSFPSSVGKGSGRSFCSIDSILTGGR
ncbi:hypothetical protein GH714_035359 [Hevea brasiliensis]|uniref:non-specific serine/threonine protein kinase n=1 Tax=Hevea brasiliensis TaxID=3981 RepID=A0A6A6KRU5_HEVBR|nr:hypothetical protein GH714_035359 [Hevea brasiliensis]